MDNNDRPINCAGKLRTHKAVILSRAQRSRRTCGCFF